MAERVFLTTGDGIKLVGDYFVPETASAGGALLLHMMPATRASWQVFAGKLVRAGWNALAIDLRGHGESGGGPEGYRSFSDAEHQATKLDVEAGVSFLKERGVPEPLLVGASIGANLALQYLAEHGAAGMAILLSPGIGYRGIMTEPAMEALRPGQRVYLAASRDDAHSKETVETLRGLAPAGVSPEFKIFDTAGHGTTMFEREPQFMDELVAWAAGEKHS